MVPLLLCLITASMADQDEIAKTITVDKWGKGDYTSVQKAIDSVPHHNTLWTRIHVKAGIYNEKVKIPLEKPYIILDGESRRTTVIQYNDAGECIASSTFQLFAENFMARRITFKRVGIRGPFMAKSKFLNIYTP
ncbi:hypothetical protein Patl1_22430 [Pistacia atlantica]|uniref:Uncharacterized protein n=1 Tax=Pistacia atlantica TaxID=434234 RepID=A0ACC0ZZ21_9ROSI|nr:hypothetical protein Patl1_22430 [Pistacia atlantica]